MRYFICPIIGTGGASDPFRAKVADYPGVSHVAVINPDKSRDWALALVKASDYSPLLADPALVALPNLELDAALGDVIARNLVTLLNARGIDSAGITASTLMREVARRIGRKIEAVFQEDNFKVF